MGSWHAFQHPVLSLFRNLSSSNFADCQSQFCVLFVGTVFAFDIRLLLYLSTPAPTLALALVFLSIHCSQLQNGPLHHHSSIALPSIPLFIHHSCIHEYEHFFNPPSMTSAISSPLIPPLAWLFSPFGHFSLLCVMNANGALNLLELIS
jgi:hypothetical protein